MKTKFQFLCLFCLTLFFLSGCDETNILPTSSKDDRQHQLQQQLIEAIYYRHANDVSAVLEAGAGVNIRSSDTTPLHVAVEAAALAVYEGDVMVSLMKEILLAKINLLVEEGADINARNGDGFTPLDIAVIVANDPTVSEKFSPVVNYLRGKGAKRGREL